MVTKVKSSNLDQTDSYDFDDLKKGGREVSVEGWPLVEVSSIMKVSDVIQVLAVASDVNLTQPAFAVGDTIAIHNSLHSTMVCRLLNPSNTIEGIGGTVDPGDDLTIGIGETVYLGARTANILEVLNG